MCLFCAAVPAALAVGANAHARRQRAVKHLSIENEAAPRPGVDPRAMTAVVVAGLLVASGVYHTQAGG